MSHPVERSMRRRGFISPCAAGLLLTTLFTSAAADTIRSPIAISPGAADATLKVATSCPTFSWAGVAAAQGYELDVSGSDKTGVVETALAVWLPAGALSWSPPLEKCLQAGNRYTWKLRAVLDSMASDWSDEVHFEISRHPAPAEVAMAYDILRRHRAATQGSAVGIHKQSGSGSEAPRSDAPRGASTGLAVDGRVEVRDIDVVSAFASGSGEILADSAIEAPNAAIASQHLILNALGVSPPDPLASFSSPTAGMVVLCEAGTSCEDGAVGNRARLVVERLFAYDGLDVGSGGLVVTSGSTPTGSGGAGYFEVPSATFTRVDNNASECPSGSIMVGVRLAETDTDQIGVQALCTTP